MDIDVAENGSGTVTVGVSLDRAAADALGDLVNQIDLEDLALAGWSVSGPAREADNLLWVRATKPFGNAEELPSILAEIAGPGVFQDVDLRQRSEFAEQTWELAGEVDPAAALPELLDTIAFNEGLQQRIRAAVGGAVARHSPAGSPCAWDRPARRPAQRRGGLHLGGPRRGSIAAPVQISMVSTDENTTAKTLRLVGLAAAALFALALLLNLLGWWYVRRHRKRRERALLARAGGEELRRPPPRSNRPARPDRRRASTTTSTGGVGTRPVRRLVNRRGRPRRRSRRVGHRHLRRRLDRLTRSDPTCRGRGGDGGRRPACGREQTGRRSSAGRRIRVG